MYLSKISGAGQDADLSALRRIIQGTQSMTVLKDAKKLAKVAIESAVKLIRGEYLSYTETINNEKKDVPTILINPIEVDKSNVFEILNDKEYFNGEM